MKKIFLSTALFVTAAASVAQQDLTLYNMRYLQQASFTNPAYFTECKFTFGGILFGSTYMRYGNNGFSASNLLSVGDGIAGQVKTLDKMGELSFAEGEFRRDLLHFGFRVAEKNYFGLNVSARAQSRLGYTRAGANLLFFGNGYSDEEGLEVGIPAEYSLLGDRASFDGSSIDISSFAEIGLQYSRRLLDDKLTVGVRPKVLLGLANISTKDFTLGLHTDESTYAWTIDGGYQLNSSLPIDSLQFDSSGISTGNISPSPFENIGFGVDLGGTYDLTEKIQVSAALTDIGFINWKHNAENRTVESANFVYAGVPIDAGIFGPNTETEDTASNFGEILLDSLINQLNPTITNEDYRTNLTGRLNLGANYQLTERQNVGLLLNGHMVRSKMRAAMSLSYNLRVHRKFGFSASYSIYNKSFLNLGLGLSFNLGPIQYYAMTDNALALVVPGISRNAHVRAGLNWTIGCKSDKDKDGIADKKDDCPEEAGPATLVGCPDKDSDGIADKDDKCPEAAGPKENNGCPDRDGDGIVDLSDDCPDAPGTEAHKGCPDTDNDGIKDSDDACPTAAGIAAFNGCPDTDVDGIQDSEDACPQKAGIAAFNGCPDTDADGITDAQDACPDRAGPAEFSGCPDTDGDGLVDNKDNCPDKKGPKANNGCPYGDRDGDGVVDKDDNCPDNFGPVENAGCPYADLDKDGVLDKDDKCLDTPGPVENGGCPYSDLDSDGVLDKDDKCINTPGPAENGGCPKIEEKEQEVLNTAFSNLEFETGKDIIKQSSFESLDNLAALIVTKPEWKIQISGHTDNVGNDAANMTLSEKRSKAVGKYLESKGVSADKLVVKWFGETKPVADNATPEGRAQNRRVEMEVLFD